MGLRKVEGNLAPLGHGLRQRTTLTTCLLMAVMFVCYTNRGFLRFPVEHGIAAASDDHLANSLTLSDAQCSALFPRAFDEIEFALSRGPVERSLDEIRSGHVGARIYNGAIRIPLAPRSSG